MGPGCRVVSYNVHACIGRDGLFAPERIVELLAGLAADFVALQEVEDRRVGGSRVVDFLAGELGMHAYRGATLMRDDADYGNLLLSRHEATAHIAHDLSVGGREPRGVIEADFRLGDFSLRLFATHLGLSAAERARQLRQIMPLLERDDADLQLLMGDFNEWRPMNALHRSLRRQFGTAPAPRTYPAHTPLFALDRIYAAPGSALRSLRTVTDEAARIASDHLPLVAEISAPHQPDRPGREDQPPM